RAYCLQRTEPISAFVRWVECYFRDACVCQLFRDDDEGPVECALDLRAETPVDFHPVYAKPVAFSGKGHPARGIWKRLDNSLKPRISNEAGEPQNAGEEKLYHESRVARSCHDVVHQTPIKRGVPRKHVFDAVQRFLDFGVISEKQCCEANARVQQMLFGL